MAPFRARRRGGEGGARTPRESRSRVLKGSYAARGGWCPKKASRPDLFRAAAFAVDESGLFQPGDLLGRGTLLALHHVELHPASTALLRLDLDAFPKGDVILDVLRGV